MLTQFLNSLTPETIYIAVGAILFLESAVIFFFFLPGDSLLFSLGLYVSQGTLDPRILLPFLIAGAVFGNIVGYALGAYFGKKWMHRGYTKKIKPEHFDKSEKFFNSYGSSAVFFSRFVPVVRTIAPFLAGVSHMKKTKYTFFSIVGGLVWVPIVVMVGYYFGNTVDIKNLELFVVVLMAMVVVIIPFLIKVIKKYILK
ncbi:MAG: DedA family protein [Minisyncoccia bacterium]